ncbi:unnamed protein product [Heterobilharzia americana]|nr:unnamed protein product [Heterobilharzia americana]
MTMELRTHIQADDEQTTTVTDVSLNTPLLIRGVENCETPAVNATNIPSSSSPCHGPAIRWADGTVDNEFMGRKKSNCCCIYEKPRRWNESSSSSSDSEHSSNPDDHGNKQKSIRHVQCTENCRGHTKRCYRKKKTKLTENANSEHQSTTLPDS